MTKGKLTLGFLTDRDTWLHLRIPFSYYLLPVFLFGISQALNIHAINILIVAIAQHLFIYPASNSYNSYMDKDEGAIGGIEHPPPVTRNMYYMSILFDVAGLLVCSLAGWRNVLLMMGYIAFSKSYSWMGIRLKKYAFAGWLSVMFFQGGYTFIQAHLAATDNFCGCWFNAQNLECVLFASLIIGGSYPLTQIYQHEEDGERGDHTISYRLGVKGTFIFSTIFFLAGATVAFHYFTHYFSMAQFLVFAACTLPLTAYFSYWFYISMRDQSNVDYKHAMWMNKISANCMIVCFIIILLMNQGVFG